MILIRILKLKSIELQRAGERVECRISDLSAWLTRPTSVIHDDVRPRLLAPLARHDLVTAHIGAGDSHLVLF